MERNSFPSFLAPIIHETKHFFLVSVVRFVLFMGFPFFSFQQSVDKHITSLASHQIQTKRRTPWIIARMRRERANEKRAKKSAPRVEEWNGWVSLNRKGQKIIYLNWEIHLFESNTRAYNMVCQWCFAICTLLKQFVCTSGILAKWNSKPSNNMFMRV